MADGHRKSQRVVLRSWERHRLEVQLMAMAYEQIQPVNRRRLGKAAAMDRQSRATTRTPTTNARSA